MAYRQRRQEQEQEQMQMQNFDGEDASERHVGQILDRVLVQIGEFGRFQLTNHILLCIPLMFNAMQLVSYMFTASPVAYRCNLSQCSNLTEYKEPIIKFNITREYDHCNQYVFDPIMEQRYRLSTSKPKCNKTIKIDTRCLGETTSRSKQYTAANEFELVCSDEWSIDNIVLFHSLGQIIGLPIGGFLADRYGRRITLTVSGYCSAIMGILKSFSTNYGLFLTFNTLETTLASMFFPTAFLLAIESVAADRRALAGTIIMICYTLGEALLGLLAYSIQNWRLLLRVLCVAAALQMHNLLLMPESVRWQLSQGKQAYSTITLKKMARKNRNIVPMVSLRNLLQYSEEKIVNTRGNTYPIFAALKDFSCRILCCSCCYLVLTLGDSLNYTDLTGNKYENFVYNKLAHVPGQIMAIILTSLMKRQWSLAIAMWTYCLILTLNIVLSAADSDNSIIWFLFGEFTTACSYQIFYIYVSDPFPACVSNSLFSTSLMIGRIAALLLPHTPTMRSSSYIVPYLGFVYMALATGIAIIFSRGSAEMPVPVTFDEVSGL